MDCVIRHCGNDTRNPKTLAVIKGDDMYWNGTSWGAREDALIIEASDLPQRLTLKGLGELESYQLGCSLYPPCGQEFVEECLTPGETRNFVGYALDSEMKVIGEVIPI
jgi:hypothetical protein